MDEGKLVDGEVLRHVLAEAIHMGWCSFMAGLGYTHGFENDQGFKTHPNIKDWDNLDDEDKAVTFSSADAVLEALVELDLVVLGEVAGGELDE